MDDVSDVIFALIVIVAAIATIVALEAASVAITAAVFLNMSFADGWHAAWARPGWLSLFAFLTSPHVLRTLSD